MAKIEFVFKKMEVEAWGAPKLLVSHIYMQLYFQRDGNAARHQPTSLIQHRKVPCWGIAFIQALPESGGRV